MSEDKYSLMSGYIANQITHLKAEKRALVANKHFYADLDYEFVFGKICSSLTILYTVLTAFDNPQSAYYNGFKEKL